ncbi:Sec-independent protein translocase subunit TatA [Streptomyces sp. NPDC001549]|uniref:Sec-independent protein translocase subunit TatA n=1 Tax=Streptomyces sp. NPDC001549 TaxID=3364586 RepID=UPI00368C2729
MFGISEIAIILTLVILVFGAKKLPELARSMGKSARILKSEARAMKNDPAGRTAAGEQPADAGTGLVADAGTGLVIEPDAVISPRPARVSRCDHPQR